MGGIAFASRTKATAARLTQGNAVACGQVDTIGAFKRGPIVDPNLASGTRCATFHAGGRMVEAPPRQRGTDWNRRTGL